MQKQRLSNLRTRIAGSFRKHKMNVNQIKQYLRDIESKSVSYNELLKYHTLFEVKGKWPDDNDLIAVISDLNRDNMETWQKLRAPYEDQPRLADSTNDTRYCHGYILFTNSAEQANSLERELIVSSLKNTISIRKIDVNSIQEDITNRQTEHFNSLFTIA